MISLSSYLLVSSMLFTIGLYGIFTRRNAVAILMGIELLLNACNINLIAFNRYNGASLDGHIFAIFVIVLAAAEAVVALAIILNLFKNIGSVDVDVASQLKG